MDALDFPIVRLSVSPRAASSRSGLSSISSLSVLSFPTICLILPFHCVAVDIMGILMVANRTTESKETHGLRLWLHGGSCLWSVHSPPLMNNVTAEVVLYQNVTWRNIMRSVYVEYRSSQSGHFRIDTGHDYGYNSSSNRNGKSAWKDLEPKNLLRYSTGNSTVPPLFHTMEGTRAVYATEMLLKYILDPVRYTFMHIWRWCCIKGGGRIAGILVIRVRY